MRNFFIGVVIGGLIFLGLSKWIWSCPTKNQKLVFHTSQFDMYEVASANKSGEYEGRRIPLQLASNYIDSFDNYFRILSNGSRVKPDTTKYVKTKFDSLFNYLGYVASHVNDTIKYKNKMYLLEYFAKDSSKRNTIVFIPSDSTTQKWIRTWISVNKDMPKENEMQAFNDGAICPTCVEDNESKVKIK